MKELKKGFEQVVLWDILAIQKYWKTLNYVQKV